MGCRSEVAGNQNPDLDTLTRCGWCGAITEQQPNPWRGLCRQCQAESINEPPAEFAPDVEDEDDEC